MEKCIFRNYDKENCDLMPAIRFQLHSFNIYMYSVMHFVLAH